jgi:hypothetical protein
MNLSPMIEATKPPNEYASIPPEAMHSTLKDETHSLSLSENTFYPSSPLPVFIDFQEARKLLGQILVSQ